MIGDDFIALLCCPVTRQPLRSASREDLDAFGSGLAEGLVSEDGRVLYPVKGGIPLLVPGDGIPLTRGPSPR
ncbi:MAG: Trm112 family protein [Terrimicrobiaceae bacterium]